MITNGIVFRKYKCWTKGCATYHRKIEASSPRRAAEDYALKWAYGDEEQMVVCVRDGDVIRTFDITFELHVTVMAIERHEK